ncbi:monosaccharide ABC transporter substrate-binding protein, CUT2 family [Faunimonas pinastri]|uniref:Monosaccharide ABC transporter substrate-binding protein, CUT2 family n=1 Tax=Faunimonas pinastri TaxID=1855383 RepID=A0A1H9C517_9HYPH|nr:ABC transporter substrate-binding protein [Faunimonas pinastri]SEP96222.1 monosaccharide ABC transporter substrate-binding protein, CUT2 family [Faunimonas pinastri]
MFARAWTKTWIAGASLVALAAASTGAQAAGKDVSLVLGVKGSPFYDALACGAKDEAKKLGLDLTVSAPDQFAADSQIPVIDAVTARGPAAAVVVPTDTQALIRPMAQLAKRGAKVLTVDQTIADTSFIQTQIVTDNEQGGRLAADAMNELLGGKGSVMMITQPPGSAGQDARAKGFEEELKKYSGITYLGPQYQSDDPQKAAEIVTSALSAHPDLAGVFSTNDQGAIGGITGLKQAAATGKVKFVAYDSATAEVAAFKNGAISVLIAQNPKQEGEVAMQSVKRVLDGGKLEKTTLTEIAVIKPGENAKADQYEYKGNCAQ